MSGPRLPPSKDPCIALGAPWNPYLDTRSRERHAGESDHPPADQTSCSPPGRLRKLRLILAKSSIEARAVYTSLKGKQVYRHPERRAIRCRLFVGAKRNYSTQHASILLSRVSMPDSRRSPPVPEDARETKTKWNGTMVCRFCLLGMLEMTPSKK